MNIIGRNRHGKQGWAYILMCLSTLPLSFHCIEDVRVTSCVVSYMETWAQKC